MIGIGIYVKDSPAAVALYRQAFGLELGYHVLNRDGSFYHAELSRKGEPFCCVVEARQETLTDRQPVELGVDFDSRASLESAFALLCRDGRIELAVCELPWSPCAAIVTDRYGVRWFLSLPQHKPSDDWSPEEDAT